MVLVWNVPFNINFLQRVITGICSNVSKPFSISRCIPGLSDPSEFFIHVFQNLLIGRTIRIRPGICNKSVWFISFSTNILGHSILKMQLHLLAIKFKKELSLIEMRSFLPCNVYLLRISNENSFLGSRGVLGFLKWTIWKGQKHSIVLRFKNIRVYLICL